ncbi:hypothetical protein [Arthrobacter sp. PAMC 25486]|uniref:hypothetical protein n=1 Tax=Arthrobacter sp. PAMC 25486 TaxID=1494608 RepID=UPI00138E284A|nr:hypothetical protein [Arthrobacter sp. PAMC 25486]
MERCTGDLDERTIKSLVAHFAVLGEFVPELDAVIYRDYCTFASIRRKSLARMDQTVCSPLSWRSTSAPAVWQRSSPLVGVKRVVPSDIELRPIACAHENLAANAPPRASSKVLAKASRFVGCLVVGLCGGQPDQSLLDLVDPVSQAGQTSLA